MSFAYLNSSLEMVANNSPQLWFVSVLSGIKKSQPWPIYVKGANIISHPRHCYGYMLCSLQSAPGSMPFFLSRASLLMPKGNSHFGMPSPYLEVRSVNSLLNDQWRSGVDNCSSLNFPRKKVLKHISSGSVCVLRGWSSRHSYWCPTQ